MKITLTVYQAQEILENGTIQTEKRAYSENRIEPRLLNKKLSFEYKKPLMYWSIDQKIAIGGAKV